MEFFIMMIIAALVAMFAVNRIGAQVNAHYLDVMEITNDEMDAWLTGIEVSAINVEDELKYNLGSPDQVYFALSDELRLNPNTTGIGVGFKPDYFPQQGRWFEPYAVRDSLGTIITKQIGGESHDYFEAAWFKEPLAQDKGCWSEPYLDEAGACTMLCTYAMPVRKLDGEVIGVLGLDLALDWLKDQLAENDRKENSRTRGSSMLGKFGLNIFSFILGDEGVYIVHPDESRVLSKTFFDYTPKGKAAEAYINAGKNMLQGKTGFSKIIVRGHRSYVFYGPLESTGWSMGIVVPAFNILLQGLFTGLLILLLIALGALIMAAVCRRDVHRATKPLVSLAESAGEIANGNFDTSLPEIKYRDEICYLRDSFDNMQKSLATYIDRLMSTTAQKASMESELAIAKNIQMSLLPKTFPPFPDRSDIDIYASLTPAKVIGGDFYDFFMQDGLLLFCTGDVSGKGVPASLVMAGISTQFRSIANHHPEPEKIIAALNESLIIRNESMMFCTLFAGTIDLKTGRLRYCNAGHNAPLVIGDDAHLLDVKSNLPIGIEPDWTFEAQEVTLAPGTTILLYTDGLTEAENQEKELFGCERMTEVADSLRDKNPQELIKSLEETVHTFAGGAEQSDDLTMMAIKYFG